MSQIENVLQENRFFPPSREFSAKARVGTEEAYERMWRESVDDPEKFFGRVARELPWSTPFGKVLDWSGAPFAKWFVGGRINVCDACVDRHVREGRGDKRALVFEGEPGDVRTLTYAELQLEVARFANVLKSRGVKKGDRVAIYMPMIPEAAIAMLACARIGAAHSVVFGGFSSQALVDRIQDGGCVAVITADGSWRRGALLALKPAVDEAVAQASGVHTVFVVRRAGNAVAFDE
ncbi:MAG: Acetyl-coenzyme ligase, partial [Planctomycetota bacterium]